MSEPIVLESNQNHATVTNNGICPTLPASMGMGGGYVPMILWAAEFGIQQSSKTRSIGYYEECSPTIIEGAIHGVVQVTEKTRR